MKILFPSEPFSSKEVDSAMKAEYEAAKLVGFEVFLFDHDEFIRSGNLHTNLPYNNSSIEAVILRGWMLKHEQYMRLSFCLPGKGYVLINSVDSYLECHYLPKALPYIQYHSGLVWYTTLAKIDIEDWEPARKFLGGDVIIKDYVKSEKGNPDLFLLSKDLTNEEFTNRVMRFVEARGKLFNEGIVLKEVLPLKKYEGQTNEWRFFYYKNENLIFNQNSDTPVSVTSPSAYMIDELDRIAIKVNSDFFTIDIAELENGTWTILEMGDGQVSGLPTREDAISFYNKLQIKINEK